MEPILKTIRELRAIQPSDEFRTRTRLLFTTSSRMGIFTYPRLSFLQTFHVAAALTATALLVTAVFGGSHYLKQAFIPKTFVGLNNSELLTEANLLQNDIDINLQEADYYTKDSRRTVAAALQEAFVTSPGHLNASVIEREMRAFTIEDSTNEEINRLLEQATL